MASQITSFTTVYSTLYSGADQRKHQSSASLAFVRRIHRSPKKFPFGDVIMSDINISSDVIVNLYMVISWSTFVEHCNYHSPYYPITQSSTLYWLILVLPKYSDHGTARVLFANYFDKTLYLPITALPYYTGQTALLYIMTLMRVHFCDIFSDYMTQVSATERRLCIYNPFSHWLIPWPHALSQYTENWSITSHPPKHQFDDAGFHIASDAIAIFYTNVH